MLLYSHELMGLMKLRCRRNLAVSIIGLVILIVEVIAFRLSDYPRLGLLAGSSMGLLVLSFTGNGKCVGVVEPVEVWRSILVSLIMVSLSPTVFYVFWPLTLILLIWGFISIAAKLKPQ